MPERQSKRKEPTLEQESAIFAAELGEALTIDLHHLHQEDARRELEAFLDHAFMTNTTVVKIIHGRGEQKLRRMVEELLAKHPLVEYWRGSQNPAQMNGVTYVVLARKGLS